MFLWKAQPLPLAEMFCKMYKAGLFVFPQGCCTSTPSLPLELLQIAFLQELLSECEHSFVKRYFDKITQKFNSCAINKISIDYIFYVRQLTTCKKYWLYDTKHFESSKILFLSQDMKNVIKIAESYFALLTK